MFFFRVLVLEIRDNVIVSDKLYQGVPLYQSTDAILVVHYIAIVTNLVSEIFIIPLYTDNSVYLSVGFAVSSLFTVERLTRSSAVMTSIGLVK